MDVSKKILLACFAIEAVVVTAWTLDLTGALRPSEDTRLGAIVRLHDKSGQFFCSGTVVSEDTIMTAAHCVSKVIETPIGYEMILSQDIDVRSSTGLSLGIYGTTVGAEQRSDQALIHGDFRKFKVMKSVTDPKKNLTIFRDSSNQLQSCGYPYSGKLFCTNIKYVEPYNFQMAVTGQMFPGMSGGPIINTATGEVIGVNTAMMGNVAVVSPTVDIYENLNITNTEGQ